MKKLPVILLAGGLVVIVLWFIKLLREGSDGAWLTLGVLGTVALYLIFSVVELVKDRLRTRWQNQDTQAGYVRRQLAELHDLGRTQGQFLINQQRIDRLETGAFPRDGPLTYEGALAGEVLEVPYFSDEVDS